MFAKEKVDTQLVQLTRGFHGGWQAGTILKVINAGPESPMPTEIAERSIPYTGPVPSNVPVVDCIECIGAARAASAAPPPPRPKLDRPAIRQRRKWDDQRLNAAMSGGLFPKPDVVYQQHDLVGDCVGVKELWPQERVEAWEEGFEKLFPGALQRNR